MSNLFVLLFSTKYNAHSSYTITIDIIKLHFLYFSDGYCQRSCEVLESATQDIKTCKFPFIYNDEIYHTCTDEDVSEIFIFIYNWNKS